MLRHVDEHPTQSILRLFASAPVTVLDVVDPLPAGTVRRPLRRRAVQLDWAAVEAERRLVEDTAERGRSDSEATAALTILAGALDLADARTRAALIPWCGAHRALVDECATYLDQLMLKLAFVTTPPGNG